MTRTIDYYEGFRNAALRSTSFIQMRSMELNDAVARITANSLAVDLDLHMYDTCDPQNPIAKGSLAVFPPEGEVPENMEQAIYIIRKLTMERNIAREICSAGANDYFKMINFLEENTTFDGTPYQKVMRETAKEMRDTGQLFEAVGTGKSDGVIYEDRLTEQNIMVDRLYEFMKDQQQFLIEIQQYLMHRGPPDTENKEMVDKIFDAVAKIQEELTD